jgi:glycerophosphoryl diester phosphodiesterase
MPMPPALRQLDWLTARPIAHRGLHDAQNGVIENTRSAFARAVAHNYAIECDLQVTADGEAVVFHDDTLDRLIQAKGRVCDHSAAALKTVAFKSGADRIQTLSELLDQIRGQVPLVIEIKSHWNGDETLARRAVATLASYDGSFCLMSFDPGIVATVRRLKPDIIRGVVADSFTHEEYNIIPEAERIRLRELAHLGQTQPDFISYYWRELPFPPVTRFREAGHKVICWTIRSAADGVAALRVSDQITFEGFQA